MAAFVFKKTTSLVMLIFTVLLAFSSSMAAPMVPSIYKVGDQDQGWNTADRSTRWAASRTFYVGDILHFEYNSADHSVLQVSKLDYESCNRATPIARYTTGDDYVTLKKSGDHYFFCDTPYDSHDAFHCETGRHKVHINVLPRTVSSSSPSPAGSHSSSRKATPTSGSPDATPTSGSSRSSATPITGTGLVVMSIVMIVAVIFAV